MQETYLINKNDNIKHSLLCAVIKLIKKILISLQYETVLSQHQCVIFKK